MGLFGPNIKKLEAKRDVQGLLAALRDRDNNVVKGAIEALGRIGEPAIKSIMQFVGDEEKLFIYKEQPIMALGKMGALAVGPLIELLRRDDFHISNEAAKALGEVGEPAVNPLLQLLREEMNFSMQSFFMQRHILNILVEIGKPATEPLYQAMTDEGWQHVRLALAIALGEMGDGRALKPLVEALRQGDAGGYVARALDNLGWTTTDAVEKAYYLIAKGHWGIGEFRQELYGLGISAVEPLIKHLKYADRNGQKHAIEFLGMIPDKRSFEPLIGFLNDEDSSVRRMVAGALGSIGDPRAIEPLSRAMKDEDKNVRESAAGALRQIPEGMEILIKALKDQDSRVRMSAAQALGGLLVEEVEQALHEVTVYDEDRSVREAAQESLRHIAHMEHDLYGT